MASRLICPALFVLLACGCATPQKGETRANTPVDPMAMIGPESSQWDAPPKLIKGKAPIYPISQLLSRNEGATVIEYTVGTDGRAKDFKVVSAANEKFGAHTIIAVKEWIFRPAMKDGVPIEARLQQTFQFAPR